MGPHALEAFWRSGLARWAAVALLSTVSAGCASSSANDQGTSPLPDPSPDCSLITRRAPPDLHWEERSLDSAEKATDLTFDDLAPNVNGRRIRIAGVLHVQFGAALVDSTPQEWFVLFSSWPKGSTVPANEWMFVQLGGLPPGAVYWISNQSRIGDRCVAVEGVFQTYRSGGRDAWREVSYVSSLSLWSTPHRPLSIAPMLLAPPLISVN
jgi:hypothetical protein